MIEKIQVSQIAGNIQKMNTAKDCTYYAHEMREGDLKEIISVLAVSENGRVYESYALTGYINWVYLGRAGGKLLQKLKDRNELKLIDFNSEDG
ncbi:hypothetical protein [Acinetobacter sp. ANC 3813]|uniref:hypothetical protein n=1 Tax=Acinetobacter sp. ANC 3813 TaxID=1977873 RepID=UPI000A35C062|nr:hypothetical protein [Acinetobacter sp. ANC 3813]OTG87829.1 hypothetical protein B9T34_15955 [Acinetobacter sp. ANC 3813]